MMNPMMMKMLEGMIPPEVRVKAKAAFEELQATGRTEGFFQVPNVGSCRVTIEKIEEGQHAISE